MEKINPHVSAHRGKGQGGGYVHTVEAQPFSLFALCTLLTRVRRQDYWWKRKPADFFLLWQKKKIWNPIQTDPELHLSAKFHKKPVNEVLSCCLAANRQTNKPNVGEIITLFGRGNNGCILTFNLGVKKVEVVEEGLNNVLFLSLPLFIPPLPTLLWQETS